MQIPSKLPDVGTTIFSVMTRKALERDAINLSQGFPDIPVPSRLRSLLDEAVAAGHNQYAPLHGVEALREAIARLLDGRDGHRPDAEREITVTSGATEALFDAIQASVAPGDEVVILDPAYDAYGPAVQLAGGSVVRMPLEAGSFRVDWRQLAERITARTRLIIVNNPHNPSGAVFSRTDLDELAALVHDTGILILADEVYEHIVFDARPHHSVHAHPQLRERSFVVGSFGKTFHCTGWKVGYCVAPPALTAELRKIHQYVTFATMTPAQVALAGFMAEEPDHPAALAVMYQSKRDRFTAHLERAGFKLVPTPGTYFQLADYSALSDLDDVDFADHLIEQTGVAAIPLSPFYERPPAGQRLLRFCFAKRDETLDAAGERLCRI
ncbi:aminotransferase class I/II-fold pyridoxal phosphate-dependent enzyme [Ectothiorhodospiraceae bacterium WFHF3C12]|nr:aminotransferase class I/II-fold pyridoxal phosphate-dependent enzyme [Ectothiorhodospiraceae bacterium WFHF3C12]